MPEARAKAWTVPMTADSSLYARPLAVGNAAITSAASRQTTKYPLATPTPSHTAAAAPGKPTTASV